MQKKFLPLVELSFLFFFWDVLFFDPHYRKRSTIRKAGVGRQRTDTFLTLPYCKLYLHKIGFCYLLYPLLSLTN